MYIYVCACMHVCTGCVHTQVCMCAYLSVHVCAGEQLVCGELNCWLFEIVSIADLEVTF